MTNWLVKHFVKNSEEIQDSQVRLAYGTLSGFVGIFCNILLFLIKFGIGLVIHSVAITSDAFNNLSDCLSCVVSLFGYHLSSKPADKEHPFGHGRMEYIASFVIAIIIYIVAYQLLQTSFMKVIHPENIQFTWYLGVILVATILIKFWMSRFNKKLGTKLDNITMLATSQDSLNDAVTTTATLGALILAIAFPKIPFDGLAGVMIAVFIFLSAVDITKDIIGKLLGTPASLELTKNIEAQILSHEEVLSVHDMIIHDYGPGKLIGSAHAEVDADMDFLTAHSIIDEAEREVYELYHIMMTLHLDPVVLNDPLINQYKEKVENILHGLDPQLSMHDFRLVKGERHDNLIFDILLPYECKLEESDIKKTIDSELTCYPKKLYTVIEFDRAFVEE